MDIDEKTLEIESNAHKSDFWEIIICKKNKNNAKIKNLENNDGKIS